MTITQVSNLLNVINKELFNGTKETGKISIIMYNNEAHLLINDANTKHGKQHLMLPITDEDLRTYNIVNIIRNILEDSNVVIPNISDVNVDELKTGAKLKDAKEKGNIIL